MAGSAGAPPVVAKVRTGHAPCGAASGFGSLWVAVYGTGRLVRIDPRSNRVLRRFYVARGICPVTIAAGSVWVASDKTDVVYRIDPRGADPREDSRVALARPSAAGPGRVWVSSFDHGHVT